MWERKERKKKKDEKVTKAQLPAGPQPQKSSPKPNPWNCLPPSRNRAVRTVRTDALAPSDHAALLVGTDALAPSDHAALLAVAHALVTFVDVTLLKVLGSPKRPVEMMVVGNVVGRYVILEVESPPKEAVKAEEAEEKKTEEEEESEKKTEEAEEEKAEKVGASVAETPVVKPDEPQVAEGPPPEGKTAEPQVAEGPPLEGKTAEPQVAEGPPLEGKTAEVRVAGPLVRYSEEATPCVALLDRDAEPLNFHVLAAAMEKLWASLLPARILKERWMLVLLLEQAAAPGADGKGEDKGRPTPPEADGAKEGKVEERDERRTEVMGIYIFAGVFVRFGKGLTNDTK
ncbi:hypothetical protein DM02DRAFT_628281 [Periconia macrospinosa]|uniref:Uncharacterized protein n=1 Tax=Periconia macrospinosa TaxID=97972 RepID=A0A2V1DQZ4_9PLEO|nr:hypothetical protein DM02DRAFT_628281 [Periconia macrospinosa]